MGAVAQPLQDDALTERLSEARPALVRAAGAADLETLAELRLALWPGAPIEQRRQEAGANLASTGGRLTTLVAADDGGVIGFAEVSLRRDYVNGCESIPVAFLEGIYVRPERRGQGHGRSLAEAAARWGRDQGCDELASDALLANTASHQFHQRVGFAETERVVYFRRLL